MATLTRLRCRSLSMNSSGHGPASDVLMFKVWYTTAERPGEPHRTTILGRDRLSSPVIASSSGHRLGFPALRIPASDRTWFSTRVGDQPRELPSGSLASRASLAYLRFPTAQAVAVTLSRAGGRLGAAVMQKLGISLAPGSDTAHSNRGGGGAVSTSTSVYDRL